MEGDAASCRASIIRATPKPCIQKSQWSLYASFILFGAAQLLPWNVYAKSIPYFRACLGFHHEHSVAVGGYMLSSYTFTNLCAMLILVLCRWDERWISTPARVKVGLIGNILLMVVSAVLPKAIQAPKHLFWAIVAATGLAGALTAILMKGLLATMSRFPPGFTPALLGGQAASGVLASLASIFANAENNGGLLYFGSGALLLTAAFIVYSVALKKSVTFRIYLGLEQSTVERGQGEEEAKQMNRDHLKVHQNGNGNQIITFSQVAAVFVRVRWMAIGVLCMLAVTISAFTSFLTATRISAGSELDQRLSFLPYYNSMVFFSYDAGDTVGRWLPAVAWLSLHATSRLIRLFPWLRLILFLPLFACIAPIDLTGRAAPQPYFGHWTIWDTFYMILCFALGATNGYGCTLLFMYAPSLAVHNSSATNDVPSASDGLMRESAGALMGLFLNIGLVIGALSSFIWSLLLS